MKIGVIGSGVVGQQLGIGFIKIGHEVKIGTRDSSKLIEWLKIVNEKGSVGSFEETAKFGEVIIIATLWKGIENAIELAGLENFTNKVVIDVTNPLDFSQGVPPRFLASVGNSGGEIIQRILADSKVVKAFNFVSAYIMCNPKRDEGMPTFFVAGDDEDAKKVVINFAREFGWDDISDIGGMEESIWMETLAMFWIHYGFKNNHWVHAFKLLKK
ncbi:NAD(P)-binding domain-containing protein [Candidatus Woesearchaeota archaeon]|nr:NAD(P)-binding domain-containing protein [Candidatus Woesearchaeota archaeon]